MMIHHPYLRRVALLGFVAVSLHGEGSRAAGERAVESGKRDGALVIYSSTHESFARNVVDEFKSMYPEIAVRYVALTPAEIDTRIRQEAATSSGADIVWSSAMDLQMRAVREGLALSYKSPEALSLPKWATWRDQIFATTYEPIVLVYNRKFLQSSDVPTTHRQVRELLVSHPDKYCGKVATYAIPNDEVGAVPFQFDAKYDQQFWPLARAMGAIDVNTEASSASMIERVKTGRSLIAYNVAGADAIRRARRDPLIGVQFTLDYNLVLSRLMFISKAARHPNAARLWVDFLLSKRGQQQMQVADLFPIRDDVEGVDPGIALLRRASGVARPIALDEGLASLANAKTTNDFQIRWQRTIKNTEHRCGPPVGERARGRPTLARMLPTRG
jgi:iron(III) transport system substrate-binding protein